MEHDKHPNLAQSLLAEVPADTYGGTQFKVKPGDGHMFEDGMAVTLSPYDQEPTRDNSEIGYLQSIDGDSCVILRGQEGVLAKKVKAGWRITGTLSRRTVETLEQAIDAKPGTDELAPVALSGSYGDLTDKPVIPSIDGLATQAGLNASLATKVDKQDGKGLSTNDYTSAEQAKLAGIAPGATQNAPDAQLRDRTTHGGSQPISTVTGLSTALAAKADLVDGTIPKSQIPGVALTTGQAVTSRAPCSPSRTCKRETSSRSPWEPTRPRTVCLRDRPTFSARGFL
jgi:hypothetical protein